MALTFAMVRCASARPTGLFSSKGKDLAGLIQRLFVAAVSAWLVMVAVRIRPRAFINTKRRVALTRNRYG